MRHSNPLRLCAAAFFLLGTSAAIAEPSCSDWLWQSDGSYWRTCVDDSGSQYCEQSSNGYISRVSC